ncbi:MULTISPECIES: GntR family transcriptional regulator [unclassified Streptomyces]|uniref:GntR family transcriptional regulator n=1 Tax=unclassified Streptomyces TaxID=2593676 RepID=UPI00380CE9EA
MPPSGPPPAGRPRLERPGPLRERVYEALLELITTRALRPGEHLVENELADRLGVSRQPVREALQRLNAEGWVELRPAQGAYVRLPTEEEAGQLLAVRALLRSEAAGLAATRARPADVEALTGICGQGGSAVAADDLDRAGTLDALFHAKVMDLAGNAVLAGLAAQIDRRARWYHAPGSRARDGRTWSGYRDVTAAIAAGDQPLAARLTREQAEPERAAPTTHPVARPVRRDS